MKKSKSGTGCLVIEQQFSDSGCLSGNSVQDRRNRDDGEARIVPAGDAVMQSDVVEDEGCDDVWGNTYGEDAVHDLASPSGATRLREPTRISDVYDDEDDKDPWGNQFQMNIDSLANYRETMALTPELVRASTDYAMVVVLFGHPLFQYPVHKLKNREGYQRLYRCSGPTCSACKGKAKRTVGEIRFCYDVGRRGIGYFVVEQNAKPGSLSYELASASRGGYPAVVSIIKPDVYSFDCERLAPTADLDLGTDIVRKFAKRLASGAYDPAELIPEVTKDIALSAPGVGDILRILGHKRS